MEVPITDNVSGVASGTVVNWVTTAANALLDGSGISLNSFTQIMHVIPDEADWGGAAAWAYLPGRVSAFRDAYANRMGVQVSCGESYFFHTFIFIFICSLIYTNLFLPSLFRCTSLATISVSIIRAMAPLRTLITVVSWVILRMVMMDLRSVGMQPR